MAQQPINHGTTAGDGTGESLFSAFGKVNDNDAELFGAKTVFVANFAALPVTGEAGKIYVTSDDDAMYRWTGTGYDDLGGIQFVANAAALPVTGEALKIYVALDTHAFWLWNGSAYVAFGWNVDGTALINQFGDEKPLGSTSKFVRATGVGVACASGVSTPQGISAVSLLDTHSLVDTVAGTITIPADCTHFSLGLSSSPVWTSAAGTYRLVGYEVEIFAGFWVSYGQAETGNLLGRGPNAGPICEMSPVGVSAGKKIRFFATQDSGGPITPTNLSFYAQFMTLP